MKPDGSEKEFFVRDSGSGAWAIQRIGIVSSQMLEPGDRRRRFGVAHRASDRCRCYGDGEKQAADKGEIDTCQHAFLSGRAFYTRRGLEKIQLEKVLD